MNKKATELPMNVIIIALILITAAIILIAVFTGMFRKEGSELDKKISALGDFDGDDVANMFDKCPCDIDQEPPCTTLKDQCDNKMKKK